MFHPSDCLDPASKCAGDWEQVIVDEAYRSYASVCRQAIDSDLAWQWFEWSLGGSW